MASGNHEELMKRLKAVPNVEVVAPDVDVVAIDDLERMHGRATVAKRLEWNREDMVGAAALLDRIGDTEQFHHIQTVLAAIDDARDSLAAVAGGKADA